MKTERLIIFSIFLTLLLRYFWATVGWGGEFLMLFPVYFAILSLLIYYYLHMSDSRYKIVLLYLAVYIIAIAWNFLEWRGGGLLLFVGSLGFLLFAFFFQKRVRSINDSSIFLSAILFCIFLTSQTLLFIFVHTEVILLIAHVLSYPIIISGCYLLLGKHIEKDILPDEKKILVFIIIVNILALLGVTFKKSFYYFIWL